MNFIITIFVGLIMLVGAGMTYHYRMLEAEAEGIRWGRRHGLAKPVCKERRGATRCVAEVGR